MDVTDQNSINNAYQEVLKNTSLLDALINFAGILRVGSMIEMPEDSLRQLLDINL